MERLPVATFKGQPICSPIVASIPHSGLWIPERVRNDWLASHAFSLRNTDWYLDQLYDFLPQLGIQVVVANFNRYVIDPNRSLDEPLFGSSKTSVVYERNTWDEPIYRQHPDDQEIQRRIQSYYLPFHMELEKVLRATIKKFGEAFLFDLHSFMGPVSTDVCLGNCRGASSGADLLLKIGNAFEHQMFSVEINSVYSGGYITKHYAKLLGAQCVQIELHYPIYLNSDRLDLPEIPRLDNGRFQLAKDRLTRVFENIVKNAL